MKLEVVCIKKEERDGGYCTATFASRAGRDGYLGDEIPLPFNRTELALIGVGGRYVISVGDETAKG